VRLTGTARHGASAGPAPPVTADDRVGTVAQRAPRVREAMDRLGLNHCCGAHLTIAEAAATAGLSAEDVVRALNQALAAPA
jgi:iron-sulfur cluster repair protein YtfE (RIC family)